jgi:hypothetical protein
LFQALPVTPVNPALNPAALQSMMDLLWPELYFASRVEIGWTDSAEADRVGQEERKMAGFAPAE